MKRVVLEFVRRGLIALGLGPIILAVVYLFLKQFANVETLTVSQVCIGIFSLSILAFIAGGMNVIYKIERLPLMVAILIHGGVLYISYLATYLVNGWLKEGITSVIVFTGIFVLGYVAVWVIIYTITKRNTERLNEKLKKKQMSEKAE